MERERDIYIILRIRLCLSFKFSTTQDKFPYLHLPFKFGTQEHYLLLPRGRFRGHRWEEHALRAIGVPSTGDPNRLGGTAGWMSMLVSAGDVTTWCHVHGKPWVDGIRMDPIGMSWWIQPPDCCRRRIKHTKLLLHLPLPHLWPYWKHLHQAPWFFQKVESSQKTAAGVMISVFGCHLRSKTYSFQE